MDCRVTSITCQALILLACLSRVKRDSASALTPEAYWQYAMGTSTWYIRAADVDHCNLVQFDFGKTDGSGYLPCLRTAELLDDYTSMIARRDQRDNYLFGWIPKDVPAHKLVLDMVHKFSVGSMNIQQVRADDRRGQHQPHVWLAGTFRSPHVRSTARSAADWREHRAQVRVSIICCGGGGHTR